MNSLSLLDLECSRNISRLERASQEWEVFQRRQTEQMKQDFIDFKIEDEIQRQRMLKFLREEI